MDVILRILVQPQTIVLEVPSDNNDRHKEDSSSSNPRRVIIIRCYLTDPCRKQCLAVLGA